jgi:hypothetical protein
MIIYIDEYIQSIETPTTNRNTNTKIIIARKIQVLITKWTNYTYITITKLIINKYLTL